MLSGQHDVSGAGVNLHGLENDRGKQHPEHRVTEDTSDARRKDGLARADSHRGDDCSGPEDAQESGPTA